MRVIFLDFDGVMDPIRYYFNISAKNLPKNDKYGTPFDPKCVQNLRRIIEETGADIVVSSSWKTFMTYKEILEMWKYRNLPGFVTDVTPDGGNIRGDEIDLWLNDCQTKVDYVIIDDMDRSQFNEHQHDHLFVVDRCRGLDEETAKKIIAKFKEG